MRKVRSDKGKPRAKRAVARHAVCLRMGEEVFSALCANKPDGISLNEFINQLIMKGI